MKPLCLIGMVAELESLGLLNGYVLASDEKYLKALKTVNLLKPVL